MKKIIFLLALTPVFAMVSCKKDPANTNEQEQITTLRLTLVNTANSSDVRTASFSDIDGAGGNAPLITDLVLDTNSSYNASILLLDETKTPADTISDEVLAEGTAHQLFFLPSAGLALITDYNDVDSNNAPIGLQTIITTTVADTGTYQIILKHQPDGLKNGSIVGGETDIDVQFNVFIQ